MPLGRMIGASIEAGPSPTTSAAPFARFITICRRVIEKSAATPTGRSVCGLANRTCSGRLQTFASCSSGCSGTVHVDSSVGVPEVMLSTAACANLFANMAARAAEDGHVACA